MKTRNVPGIGHLHRLEYFTKTATCYLWRLVSESRHQKTDHNIYINLALNSPLLSLK